MRLIESIKRIGLALWPFQPKDILRGPDCESCGAPVGRYHKVYCPNFKSGQAHHLPDGMELKDVQRMAVKNHEKPTKANGRKK